MYLHPFAVNIELDCQPPSFLRSPAAHSPLRSATWRLEKIFDSAIKKAGIRKEVSVHFLRHSFAKYLLESGTDLRYIQELLGHKSSKTTEIYAHVSNKNIGNIKCPLDSLHVKGGEND